MAMEVLGALEPSTRVRQLAEKIADMVAVDATIPIKRYFRSGKEMIKMANVYYDEEDWERSFSLYNKYITLFVEKLPKNHPGYKGSQIEDIKESKKTVKAAFPRAEETKIKVKERYQVEYDRWLAQEQKRKEEESRLAEEARQREEQERLQGEREAAMGEEERRQLREERERQSLAEQQRILEEQKAALLREQQQEQERREEERRMEEQAWAAQTVIPPIRPGAPPPPYDGPASPTTPIPPAVDRSLKVDRSAKPAHLVGSGAAQQTNKYGFRTVMVPDDTTVRFMHLAEPYTSRNVEFCGILAGKLAQHAFTITHIVIPKQEGTSDSCTALNEEDMFDVMDKNDLITLGWIHTHPSQTAFLSSVDLHTHCPYQIMLPEALAIVCAPKHKEIGFFSLTPDHGLKLVSKCTQRGFHEHPKHPPLFEDSEHCSLINDLNIQMVDLR